MFICRQFAKSIREKATDMALGLVQPPLQSRDMPTTAVSKTTTETFFTPKHTRKQRTISISNVYGTTRPIDIRMDIVLDTPVLVLPRSSCSSQVFVVHLGKISMTNNPVPEVSPPTDRSDDYNIRKFADSEMRMFTIDEEMFLSSDPAEMTTDRNNRHFYGDDINYCSEEDLNDERFDRIGNCFDYDTDDAGQQVETYILDVRNINAYSLDTRSRKGFRL